MVKIIQRRKIWFVLSIIMIIASIAALAAWKLKFGIDFTGGTMMEVGFNGASLSSQEISDALKDRNLGEISVQPSEQGSVFLKFKSVDEATHQDILASLNKKIADKQKGQEGQSQTPSSAAPAANSPAPQNPATPQITAKGANGEDAPVSIEPVTEGNTGDKSSAAATADEKKYISEKSFESIGPVVGNELKSSAIWAIIIAVIAIILYIAWAFRKVSYPVSSFKYGIIAAAALLHDVLTTVGVFAVLGHFLGVEVGVSFVAALLTILGYSVHDTIVVFDRTRENLFKYRGGDFEETVNKCVNETLIRSINTSFTVILVLTVLFLLGGPSIRYFVLALIVGITVGTYSSIFVASPLLVTWQQFDLKRKGKS